MSGRQGDLLPGFSGGYMLSRKVVTRHGHRVRGYFPSLKTGRMVAWESQLERDAILLFEFSPGVRTFREQPVQIQFQDGETPRRYFPDFEITCFDEEIILLEVKPESELQRPEIAQKLGAISAHFSAEGIRYRILTENVIRREPLAGNLKLLRRYHRCDEAITSVLPEVKIWLRSGPCALNEMQQRLSPILALRLIGQGHVGCDLFQPLSGSSLIFHPEEINRDQIFF
jgi:hypothetical protein